VWAPWAARLAGVLGLEMGAGKLIRDVEGQQQRNEGMWAVALKAREGYARGPYLRTDFSRRSSLTTSGSGRPPILSWPPPAALFLPFPWLAEFATDAVPLAMPSPAVSRPARLGLDISSLPVLLVSRLSRLLLPPRRSESG
jgi:hypothetical protein